MRNPRNPIGILEIFTFKALKKIVFSKRGTVWCLPRSPEAGTVQVLRADPMDPPDLQVAVQVQHLPHGDGVVLANGSRKEA